MRVRSPEPLLVLVVILASMAALAACRAPTAPAARSSQVTLVPHVFHTDDGQLIPSELGRLTVPENREGSSARTIDIAFVRFKSTSKTPGPPLFLLEGGPGLSGISNTRAIMYALLPVLLDAGDVITFDQRGVGLSRPTMDCPETWAFPLDTVRTRETLVAVARDRARACASFWSARGVDVTACHTNASADDIDAIRSALGVEKMALLGGSYGSHLTLATIRRHGARVSRAIMNGTEGPDDTLKLPSNVQKQIENVARLVAADPAMHRLVPDFQTLMRSVLDRLDRAPVSTMVDDGGREVPITLSRFDLQLITAQNLGSTRVIRQLPAAYYDMAHNDFSWLAGQVLKFSHTPFTSAMTLEMDCASGVSPARATPAGSGDTRRW